MTGQRAARSFVLGSVLLILCGFPTAQAPEVFRARLTSLPIDATTAPTMRGSGTATATFDGKTLTISGRFEGFNSPATLAHIHRAQPGMRGPVVFNLTVTQGIEGSFEGKTALTSAQAADIRKGWFYIQIHTQANPDGQVRGWLLK